MLPDLNPELILDMLRRTSYSDVQEREPKMTASVIIAMRNDGASAAAVLEVLSEVPGITQKRYRSQ